MASGSQRSIARATEIGRVATRHGFGYLVERRRATDGEPDADRGRRLREMLDELGPTFVKFGQLLSTRPDVVPPDIIAELRKLQDDVTPFPMEDVERVVRRSLGRLGREADVGVEFGLCSGDPVAVAVRVPMAHAAPNLLWPIGYDIDGEMIHAHSHAVRE